MVKLYVITGSHACRTAMLALEAKGVGYRLVELPTGLHPTAVRALGFAGNRTPIRQVDGRTHAALAAMDRMGTVPALNHDGRRVQTNREIFKFLEELRPEPSLFPAQAERRARVEEAVKWGNEALQMTARRVVMAAGALPGGLRNLHEGGGRGRMGALLSHRRAARVAINAFAARTAFKAGAANSSQLVASLGPMLDRVDGWIADGTLDGERLNAADLMIAPSLALLDYRLDLRGALRSRPLFGLLERILPEPS